MKKLISAIAISSLFACSNPKQDAPKQIKEIVCGDSIEQELFDDEGNSYTMKVPGKCDTIYESTAD
ncbi:MAG: hypothetical protein MUF75_10430 [Bacteroidia bacterium]|jgi:hypothetical protein|nr:hypothetical protein [Bacteroidia bacterium]